MYISFSPMRMDQTLTGFKQGDVLTLNGVPYDFGPLPDGATLPCDAVGCEWIVSDVERIAGQLHLTLRLPHGFIPYPAPIESLSVLFPSTIIAEDGDLELPTYVVTEAPDNEEEGIA